MTLQELNIGGGASAYGRITTPYPLWDGTDRVLVGYTPCEVTRKGVVVSCATLTAEDVREAAAEATLLLPGAAPYLACIFCISFRLPQISAPIIALSRKNENMPSMASVWPITPPAIR